MLADFAIEKFFSRNLIAKSESAKGFGTAPFVDPSTNWTAPLLGAGLSRYDALSGQEVRSDEPCTL
jgi:hypothetical protein